MSRYIATHATQDMPLSADWDDGNKIAKHRQKDFGRNTYVHVVDTLSGVCIACGLPLSYIRGGGSTICAGPAQHNHSISPGTAPGTGVISGGIVGTGSTSDNLKDMIEKYKLGSASTDCQTGAEKQAAPAKSEKVIAESAKPTTGVDWEAHKQFMRGL